MTTLTFILWVWVTGIGWSPVTSFYDYDLCLAGAERSSSMAICLLAEQAPWQYSPPAVEARWSWQPRLEEAI